MNRFPLISTILVIMLILTGCNEIPFDSTDTLRIAIYGRSDHPVDIDWTIHGISGSSRLTLNHTNEAPYVIQREVDKGSFSTVEITIADAGSTANNLVQDSVSLGGVLSTTVLPEAERTVNLGADYRVSGVFPVEIGDFLRDATGDYYMVVQAPDPASPSWIVVSDAKGTPTFTDGTWELYTSNQSSVTVEVTRDGRSVSTATEWTDSVEALNFTHGGAAW